MGRKKSSDAIGKMRDFWSMKRLISRLKKSNSAIDSRMVIGIDFGTTYSGAAWASVADFEAEHINLVTSWPGTEREEGKAPSEIFYEEDQVKWGYEVPADADPIRWLKLLLLREEDLTAELKESQLLIRARQIIKDSKKTTIDLIADYLRALWGHILDRIRKKGGESAVEALTFHVVVTVPAIWKDYARVSMREAAKKSGLLDSRLAGPTTMAFAPEPEAAALASLYESKPNIDTGDVFVICDAGGGTVDLISYLIGSTDPIELHEAVIGTGGLCGGILIDEAFESMVKDRLGGKCNKLTQNSIKDIMKIGWEDSIKPHFKLDNKTADGCDFVVPVAAFEGFDINDISRKSITKNRRIPFTSSDILKAFAASFAEIEGLVDEQIRKIKAKQLSVTGIILVGGLGSSPYLYESLKERYAREDIDVLRPASIRLRSAVCRGAIFKGFLEGSGVVSAVEPGARLTYSVVSPISVVSTIARVSLGVIHWCRYKEGVHSEKDKEWNQTEGTYFALNQITWYLRKGDDVPRMKPKKYPWYQCYNDSKDFDPSQKFAILQCEDDDPPTRLAAGVKVLCFVKCDFGITYDMLEDQVGVTGYPWKRLSYEMEMIPSGASNEFSLLYKGKKMGSRNVQIDFQ